MCTGDTPLLNYLVVFVSVFKEKEMGVEKEEKGERSILCIQVLYSVLLLSDPP